MQYRKEITREQSDLLFYAEALKSDECQCGKRKQRGRAVCYKCWVQLPDEMHRDLYQKLGDGFEEAYDKACRFINDQ